ncbi:MAG TPA: hypothetical protein VK452_08420 [Dissulfurispiraceae bacterium]|nr:hypothetical protein [Dissulfurispiraceae bacterium]
MKKEIREEKSDQRNSAYLSKEELDSLRDAASKLGMSISAYARDILAKNNLENK